MAASTAPTTAFITVAGKKTQLTKGGSGPPLLYLHSSSGETEWMPFHAALALRHTVYLPAHPGFALSEGLDDVDTVVDLAWHYVDLIEQLGTGPLPVVGFSLGGWIGTQLAILRPKLVRKLVLVASAGLHLPSAPMAEMFIDDLKKLKELVFFDPANPAAELALPTSLDDPRIIHWLRAREAAARVGWNPYMHDPKLPEHLRRVSCPALVLWGRHDRLIPPAHGEYFAKHIPGAHLEVFDRCGHMLPFEKPQEFVSRVHEFLQA
jgi:pimeloyl-ACP methyl ester carboxylesterase